MNKSSNNPPKVSIIMTAYNRADFIREAIESVLNQTYKNWELLILDDGSTDNTAEVVKKLAASDSRIIYLPSRVNLGISRNRNRGLSLARGKYLAVLDSDDIWLDHEKLEKQVLFLQNNPEHILVGTNVKVIDAEGEEIGCFQYEREDERIRRRMLLRNQFTHSSIMIRTGALVGEAYDEVLPIWEDYDLILRLGLCGKLANLPSLMTAYRRHSDNISRTTKHNGAKMHLAVIKKYRNQYPNYFPALLKGYLRLIASKVL